MEKKAERPNNAAKIRPCSLRTLRTCNSFDHNPLNIVPSVPKTLTQASASPSAARTLWDLMTNSPQAITETPKRKPHRRKPPKTPTSSSKAISLSALGSKRDPSDKISCVRLNSPKWNAFRRPLKFPQGREDKAVEIRPMGVQIRLKTRRREVLWRSKNLVGQLRRAASAANRFMGFGARFGAWRLGIERRAGIASDKP